MLTPVTEWLLFKKSCHIKLVGVITELHGNMEVNYGIMIGSFITQKEYKSWETVDIIIATVKK